MAPNDGSDSVSIPNVATNTARIRIEAANGNGISAGNTWFDVTDTNIVVTASAGTAVTAATGSPIVTSQGAPAPAAVNVVTLSGGAAPYTVSAEIYPANQEIIIENLAVSGSNVLATARASCQIAAPNAPNFRSYPAVLRVSDSAGSNASTVFNVNVSNNLIPTIGTFSNQVIPRGNSVSLSPSAPPADANSNFQEVRVSPSTLPGGGTVTVNASTGVVIINTTAATTLGSYLIKVIAFDSCGAGGVATILATVASNDAVLQLSSNTITSGNAILEPNECNTLNIALSNIGGSAATGVSSVLSSSTPGVTIASANSTYPNIAGGGSSVNTTAFKISSATNLICGSNVNLTQTVSFAGAGAPTIFNFSLPVGLPAAANYTIATSEAAPAAPGSQLVDGSQDDDATVPVTLPAGFAFSIYGTPVTLLRADTNGILGFNATTGASSAGNGPLPAGIFSTPSVVAHWDDLDGSANAVTGGGVYTAVSKSAPNRIFDIEWRMTRYIPNAVPGPPTIVFTVRLHETSNLIEIVYTNVVGNIGQNNSAGSNGVSATIGIQAAASGTQLTQFSFDTASLAANRKLSFARAAGLCQQGAGVCVDPGTLFKNGFED